jgi:hypothetical protein
MVTLMVESTVRALENGGEARRWLGGGEDARA